MAASRASVTAGGAAGAAWLLATVLTGCGQPAARPDAGEGFRPDGETADAAMDAAVPTADAAIEAAVPGVDGGGDASSVDASCGPASCDELAWVWDRTWAPWVTGRGYGLAIDAVGNAFVVGMSDAFITSYARDGALRWDHHLSRPGSTRVNAVAVDDDGNLLVTGCFNGTIDFGGGARESASTPPPPTTDVFIVSYRADGSYGWDRTFGTAFDCGEGVAVDAAGNVFVVGYFSDGTDFGGGMRPSAGEDDAFIASYGPDGSYRWDHTFGGGVGDAAHDVAFDGAGNVVVVGNFRGTTDFGGGARTSVSSADNGFVVVYASDGTHLWDRHFGGAVYARVRAVAFSSPASPVVAGQFGETVDFGGGPRRSAAFQDGFIVSYGPDGSHRWDRVFAGTGSDASEGVAVDAAGNVVVAGKFWGGVDFGGGVRASGIEFCERGFIAGYALDGSHRWDRTLLECDTGAHRVAMDADGSALVTGSFNVSVDLGGGARTGGGGFLLRLGCPCP